MKPVNLLLLASAHSSLSAEAFQRLCAFYEIQPKKSELLSISELVNDIMSFLGSNRELPVALLDNCFFGYSIPHIGKELDCLWIGNSTIVNVELKSEQVQEGRMKKQLAQNRYYLKALGKQVFTFTFESKTHKYYSLDDTERFSSITQKEVAKCLYDQIDKDGRVIDEDIDSLFNPCDYLVSPFNSTERFLSGEYFLTGQQEEIKAKILKSIISAAGAKFYAITGPAGSGKTLLIYDIVKELMNAGQKVLILHSGNINEGQIKLNNAGWKIGPSKNFCSYSLVDGKMQGRLNNDGASVIVVDEAQRSYQLSTIADEIKNKGLNCIISYDPVQYLSDQEAGYNNDLLIEDLVKPESPYVLSGCIRTNQNVINFISRLFNKSKLGNINKGYINLCYCKSSSELVLILSRLKTCGYTALSFTPSHPNYQAFEYEQWFPSGLMCAHEVVGQEFDSVACVLGPDIKYNEHGQLISSKEYRYKEDKMLFQVLSRARKSLFLVIYNNPDMLTRCLEIIDEQRTCGHTK